MTDAQAAPSDETRFGRLTYTSFDGGGGTGGWQVKQRTGVDDVDAAGLRSRVNTQLDAGVELPRFASPEDVSGFPRRLVYAQYGSGAAWWHVASAGNDASGRPGNVFAQVVLDRRPDLGRAVRPIQLWRSPDWLVPYGAEAVNAAQLPHGDEPQPGALVTAESVVAFLLDLQTYRLGTLGALLDACAAAIDGGPRVALIADTVDTAALWIGAVSFLMPVRFARERFFFSTLERVSGVAAAFNQGIHLACLPPADREVAVELDGVVIIDEHEGIDIGDLGGQPHRTSRGYSILATEWAAMASVVLLDAPTALRAIDRMDQATAGLNAVGAEPGWGLAVAVSQDVDTFADAVVEAAEVITRSSPDLPEDSPVFVSASSLLREHLGESAEDVWNVLKRLGIEAGAEGGTVSQLVLSTYVDRAVRDLDWLIRPHDDGVPLPPNARLGEAAALGTAGSIIAMITELEQKQVADEVGAVASAALANLAARLELPPGELDDQIDVALERWFIHHLFATDADELVHHLGAFDERTQVRYLRRLAENDGALHSGRPPGQRLSADVTFWLFPEGPSAVPSLTPPVIESELRVELAAHCVGRDPSGFASERPLVVWATLLDPALSAADLGRLFGPPAWAPEVLMAVQQRFPSNIRSDWMVRTLKSSPYSDALKALCWQLLGTRPTHAYLHAPAPAGFEDLVRLRYYEREQWFSAEQDAMLATLAEIIEGGSYAAARFDVEFDPGAFRVLVASAVLAGVMDVKREHFVRIRQAVPASMRHFDTMQQQIVFGGLHGKASLGRVGLIAIAADENFPEGLMTVDQHYRWMNTCVVDDGGESIPILRQYVVASIEASGASVDLFKAGVAASARRRLYTEDNVDKLVRNIEKFAGAWFKTVLSGNGRPSRRKAFYSS